MNLKWAFELPGSGAKIRAFVITAVLGIVFQFFADFSNLWLIYDRDAVLSGQWWRLLTGNIVHINFAHLWLNLGAFLAILVVFPGKHGISRILFYLISCGIAVTAGIQLFSSDIEWYSGLSGVLHGVFIIKAYDEWSVSKKLGGAMVGALGIKLGYEQLMGGSENVARLIGGPVAVDAHLFGAIGGFMVVLGLLVSGSKGQG